MTDTRQEIANVHPPRKRRENLRNFGRWLQRFRLFWVVVVFTGLPFLTKGTEFHESALLLRRSAWIGVLCGWVQLKCFIRLRDWNQRTSRPVDIDNIRYLAFVYAGVLPGTPIAYVLLRLTGSEGGMESLRFFSWSDASVALIVNVLLATLIGYFKLAATHYWKGESVLFKNKPATPATFWFGIVAPMLAALLLLLGIGFAAWIEMHSP